MDVKSNNLIDLSILSMSEEDVQKLTFEQRQDRVKKLLEEAFNIVNFAINNHCLSDKRKLAGIFILYSGGNDSTVLAHIFKSMADYALHANTGIGIEQTRQFVRDTCQDWGLPLLEYHPPPGCTYKEQVMEHGFPGPGMHYIMYQRLKERCIEQARQQFVKHRRQQRILLLTGRRRTESNRRANVPELSRRGSLVWCSPLVNWTKVDLNTYRQMMGDVPRNEVADLIHMSGECLCGAFAKYGELDEINVWFPDVVSEIRELEKQLLESGKIPEQKCKWGWGAKIKISDDMKSGPMCSSCESRMVE